MGKVKTKVKKDVSIPLTGKGIVKPKSNGTTLKMKKVIKNEFKKEAEENPLPKAEKSPTKKKDKKKMKEVSLGATKDAKGSKGGDDFSDALRQELEVLIKNLNREGNIEKHFVVDDDSVVEEVDDNDENISIDENYEDEDDDVEIKSEPTEVDSSPKVEKKKKKKDKKKLLKEVKKEPEIKEEDEYNKKAKTKKEQKTKPANEPKNTSGDTMNVKLDRADYLFVKEVRKERQFCLLRPKNSEPWYKIVEPKPETAKLEGGEESSEYWIMKIEKFAKKLLDEEIANFNTQNAKETKKSSEKKFIETVLRSGTLSDKISAYVVLIQESPVHNLSTVQTLIDMISLKSRRPCMLALDALQNLFANTLLVPDRKLRQFKQCPIQHLDILSGGNKDTRDKYLMIWLYEQQLKSMYSKFLAALAEVGKDTIEKTRTKVMSVILDLLISNAEQEQELLSRLVNKLGDPVRKVAAKATYQIGLLLEKHPAMKSVVLSEIERLLHRTNIASRAQYYGICCLTQLVLDEDEDEDKKLANKLITIYFSFFKASIKRGEIDSKLISALLTGVHRAYPFAAVDTDVMNDQMETMYKITHMSTFNIAIQAFMLLFQVMGSGGESVSDRFYNAFYKRILSPDLQNSSKPALFLNLAYKLIKNDPSPNRVLAFIKRLLQLSAYWPPSLVCSTLYLISEVVKVRPEINLLKKVDEGEADGENGATNMDRFDDDGEVDDFTKDVPLSDDEETKPITDAKVSENKSNPSWVHRKLNKTQVHGSRATHYSPAERNPMFSGAEKTNVWELHELGLHVHPSAALFAQTLLEGKDIQYTGDPLSDFTLMRFLDRFVFRNPKKDPGKNKPHNVFSKRNVYQAPSGVKRLAPDSKEYIDRDESQVPLDERFIFRFFRDKQTRVSDPQDSDAESVNSDDAMEALEMYGEEASKDLDFASALESEKSKKTGKKRKADEDDDDDDESDQSDADSILESDEEEGDVSEEDELILDGDDDDEEDDFEEVDDFDGMEDDFETTPSKPAAKKSKKLPKKLRELQQSGQLFASAEEFSSLIDESEVDPTSGAHDQIFNSDRSSAKQLKWENQRHSDFKPKGGKKFSRKGNFGAKKFTSNKFQKKKN